MSATTAGGGEGDAGSDAAGSGKSGRGKWNVVLALASAQFIMVLDSTVMNVSIEEVITDLDTTVTKMQLAIAAYTLCMAALMLLGGKIGDIIGRLKAFRIGLVLFGIGAGITSIAPSIGVLIAGWSVIEACGAALMIPAVAALIASNYEGRDRAICFGIIGGVVGAACGGRPDHRRRRRDGAELALGVRGRGRDRALPARRLARDPRHAAAASGSRSSTRSAPCSRPPGSACSCSGSSRAPTGAGSTRRTR